MAADPAVVKALSQTDLFASLSRRALAKVAAQAKEVRHEAGKQITEQGEKGVGFHLITSGTATVSIAGKHRSDLGPGDYFGEISLIDGKPRVATVTASSPLVTLSLVSWLFRPILEEEVDVANTLLQLMCTRLRASEARALSANG